VELLTPQEAAAFLKSPTRSIYELSMSPMYVSHRFKRLRDALKLPDDCVLHSCRHTFCTRLGAAGVSAFQIMALAGHSSVAISQRYVHEDQQALKDAIGKL
jgi:integrase